MKDEDEAYEKIAETYDSEKAITRGVKEELGRNLEADLLKRAARSIQDLP